MNRARGASGLIFFFFFTFLYLSDTPPPTTTFFFFFFFGLFGVLLVARAFSLVGSWGLLSSRDTQASHCSGFSC